MKKGYLFNDSVKEILKERLRATIETFIENSTYVGWNIDNQLAISYRPQSGFELCFMKKHKLMTKNQIISISKKDFMTGLAMMSPDSLALDIAESCLGLNRPLNMKITASLLKFTGLIASDRIYQILENQKKYYDSYLKKGIIYSHGDGLYFSLYIDGQYEYEYDTYDKAALDLIEKFPKCEMTTKQFSDIRDLNKMSQNEFGIFLNDLCGKGSRGLVQAIEQGRLPVSKLMAEKLKGYISLKLSNLPPINLPLSLEAISDLSAILSEYDSLTESMKENNELDDVTYQARKDRYYHFLDKLSFVQSDVTCLENINLFECKDIILDNSIDIKLKIDNESK